MIIDISSRFRFRPAHLEISISRTTGISFLDTTRDVFLNARRIRYLYGPASDESHNFVITPYLVLVVYGDWKGNSLELSPPVRTTGPRRTAMLMSIVNLGLP